jgi:hypothetical protein
MNEKNPGTDNSANTNGTTGSNGNGNGNETRNFSGQPGASQPGRTEEFTVSGDDIMARLRQLIEEGNARRIILRKPDGQTLLEIPLTAGVIGVALLPIYAAIGAAVALAANLTIVVEKKQ